jgi:transcriptional antiterminator NusG
MARTPATKSSAKAALGEPDAELPPQQDVVINSGDPDRKWYVIHTYSGYENKVKTNLEHRISTMDVADRIFQVVIPMEGEVEVKDGQRRTVQRKVFPGYVLVDMKLDDQSWYVVRNTPGVTGFVGSGNKPIPLEESEVRKILKQMTAEAPRVKIAFEKGQSVRIIDGPFADFIGVVDEILQDKGKIRVMVSFFGRETPIELDFLQVEKL